MRIKKSLFAALALSAFASIASAETYVGGNYAFIDADDLDLGALVFKGGIQLNQWAAVEARAGFGVKDDSIWGVDVELDYLIGGYLIAGLPNNTPIYPYAIAGYTQAKASASGYGNSASDDDSDFSYGAGVNYNINQSIAANLEFGATWIRTLTPSALA